MKPFALSILTSLAAVNVPAQTPADGMFLVATPQLRDPRFAETVVLVLNHDLDGTIGLVVNRPTWVEPEELFPEADFFRRYRGAVYFGGPVARTKALFLVRNGDIAEGKPVIDDIRVTVDVDAIRENLPSRTDERVLRVYAGHAGWAPGQLDKEISSGDWRVTPASGDLIFTPEPTSLWRHIHRTRHVPVQLHLVDGLPTIQSHRPIIACSRVVEWRNRFTTTYRTTSATCRKRTTVRATASEKMIAAPNRWQIAGKRGGQSHPRRHSERRPRFQPARS